MSDPDWEQIQRRQMAQQQLTEVATQVRRLIVHIAGHEQTLLQQNDQVQSLIRGTETGADHAIARHLGDASSAIQQAVQSLLAAEAQCRSAGQS